MYNQEFIDDLIIKRDLWLDQVHHLDAIIAFHQSNHSIDTNSIGRKLVAGEKMPYDKSDNYQIKIAKILKHYNRFMSINEMANVINAFENKVSIEDAKNSLGSAKNLLLKEGSLVKYQVGTNNSNSFYGSKYWLGEDGKPLPDNMYNEASVIVKNKITI